MNQVGEHVVLTVEIRKRVEVLEHNHAHPAPAYHRDHVSPNALKVHQNKKLERLIRCGLRPVRRVFVAQHRRDHRLGAVHAYRVAHPVAVIPAAALVKVHLILSAERPHLVLREPRELGELTRAQHRILVKLVHLRLNLVAHNRKNPREVRERNRGL